MQKPISPSPEADVVLPYSQGMLISGESRTLYVSGQIGSDSTGKAAADFDSQARQAWRNLIDVLKSAQMSVNDLVKVTAFLTSSGDVSAYGKIRSEFLGGHKPASTLLIVSALARPEWRVEIEAIAVADV